MTKAKRRAVLEESSLDYIYGLLRPTGIECFRFTKAELIEKVLKLEGKVSEPAEPSEPTEPTEPSEPAEPEKPGEPAEATEPES